MSGRHERGGNVIDTQLDARAASPIFSTDASALLPPPSVQQVRGAFDEESRKRSTPLGVMLFLLSWTCYAATFVGTLVVPGWPLKLIFAGANGLCIAIL